MTQPVCPCDDPPAAPPRNLPQLSHIDYRIGTWRDFRRWTLTPLAGETMLSRGGSPVWRTQGQGDLAVMAAEWFAYLADILTFYNERIANQDYLRTADLPESVNRLIRLLGYRPRPAVGATGTLAALVTAGQSAVLPKGLQFQSKPGPGQAPQTFELSADTAIGAPDQVTASPAPYLLNAVGSGGLTFLGGGRAHMGLIHPWHVAPIGAHWPSPNYSLLVQGTSAHLDPGALLRLRPRDAAQGAPLLATVSAATVQPADGGGSQTALDLAIGGTPPTGLAAAGAALERPNQSIGLWSFFAGAVSGQSVHLASLARQIRPGDQVLLTGHNLAPALFTVTAAADAIWDATGSPGTPAKPASANAPVPIPHTVLTLNASPSASVTAVGFDWIGVGALTDQPWPVWTGSPTALTAAGRTTFPQVSGAPVLVQDSTGQGFITTASSGGDNQVRLGAVPDPAPALAPPFQVLFNPLPVNRGRTVTGEVLGNGDATVAGQDFTLSQSPVTWLQKGAAIASTVSVTVDGEPWTEAAFFYGQASDAQIFVTREDEAGQTHVMFGDGINGARLPTGTNNVVAAYSVGAGADSPPAGKLTVIAQSFPGLRAVLNPVAVGGGADPDPADQVRRYAPRSVLTFGRAVGVFDYEAIAALAPGVSRARAVWAWNDARQRTLVTVYVGDDAPAAATARAALSAAGDPNRPVVVVQAKALAASLAITLIITPGMDGGGIIAAATAALVDPDTGLFSAVRAGVGQAVFDSQIEAAVLSAKGAVAIRDWTFSINGAADAGPLHDPGEGGYFDIGAAGVSIVTEADPHG